MTEMQSFPSQPLEPELVYDPYAKIVVNVSPSYASVTPEVLEAHQVTSLKNNETVRTQRIIKLNGQIDNVREYLLENYNELDNHADEIARLLDIELTNEVTVDVNVTFSATITLPMGTDANDVEGHDFSFDLISENSDYEIQDFDTYVIYCNEG